MLPTGWTRLLSGVVCEEAGTQERMPELRRESGTGVGTAICGEEKTGTPRLVYISGGGWRGREEEARTGDHAHIWGKGGGGGPRTGQNGWRGALLGGRVGGHHTERMRGEKTCGQCTSFIH